LQMTFARFLSIVPAERILVITNEQYVPLVAEQLKDIPKENILSEPLRRNTAPCNLFAALHVYAKDPNARLVVAPSDHLILEPQKFLEVIRKALHFITSHAALLTLGIVPVRPDTGYGYIQYHEEEDRLGVFKVKTFTEKPSAEIAAKFIKSGDFLWNSGIFIWNVQDILNAFQQHLPEMFEIFHEGVDTFGTAAEASFISKAYSQCTNVSIDYGIMEKADQVFVIPSEFGWSDLGTWQSIYSHYDKDYLGNAVLGKEVMIFDSKDCMIMAPDQKLVVLQGLEGYCVVDTPDSLLICRLDKEQEIKQITAEIKRTKGDRFL